MTRRVIDFHCDVLYKMLYEGKVNISQEDLMDVTIPRLRQGNVGIQVLALFLEPHLLTGPPRFSQVLRAIDLYREHIQSHEDVIDIRWQEDLVRWNEQPDKLGMILSLEGVDALEGDMVYLRTIYELGVRFLGLAWNNANWAVDGAQEPRKAGFTREGITLIQECDRLGITLDVSHLNEKAFWQLLELTDKPIIASHSNSAYIMPHVRNLTDEQIRAIIARDGRIGVTYVPYFVAEKGRVEIEDLVRHIDRICELGGRNHIMLGSDFDGIDKKIVGLEHAGMHGDLLSVLDKKYGAAFTDEIASGNAKRFLAAHLPRREQ
nr:membrane dipeptidase [Paenibacillus sp. ACRRX]